MNRGYGGPVKNEVMQYLFENAHRFGHQMVQTVHDADVIITNDVFTPEALDSGKPLWKRMDGIFYLKHLNDRNVVLNKAAEQADHVVFITDYSRRCAEAAGVKIRSSEVIHHWVDPTVFSRRRMIQKQCPWYFAACATNWIRMEKRFKELIRFANLFPEITVFVAGKVPNDFIHKMPANMFLQGYLDSPNLAAFLRSCDAFINFSYRDAATKTVCQAIASGLPVFYSATGGVPEMVGRCGIGIEEPATLDMIDAIPEIETKDMEAGFEKFNEQYRILIYEVECFDSKAVFEHMLGQYFRSISRLEISHESHGQNH
jgi:glycosyltransferase involved in cell wall biosynthesis